MNDYESVGWGIKKCVGAGVGRRSGNEVDSDVGNGVGEGSII